MAQQTSSTPQVTSTNGRIHTNQPINPQTIVRAESVKVRINDGRDKNLYPAILMEIEDEGKQFWYYALGDEATRDSDYTTLDASICPPATAPRLYDAVVDAAGNGDYLLPSQALAAGACSLFVRAGLYNETDDLNLLEDCIIVGESSGSVISFASGNGIIVDGGGVDKSGGTITLVNNDDTIIGAGTSFGSGDVGRTININQEFFTIATYVSPTEITIDKPWEGDAATGVSYVIRDYVKGVILDTLVLVGSSGGANTLVNYTKVLNSVIKNVAIEGGDFNNLFLNTCGRIAIDNVISRNAVNNGVTISGSVSIKISKSVFSNCTVNGFEVSASNAITIGQSYTSNNSKNGIEILGSGDVTISEVNASFNNDRGIDADNSSSAIVIDSCYCEKNGGDNIVSNSLRTIISNCNIIGKGKTGGEDGIFVNINRARVVGNRVENCPKGFQLGSTSRGTVLNDNEAFNCGIGFEVAHTENSIVSNTARECGFGFNIIGTGRHLLASNRAYDGVSLGLPTRGFKIDSDDNFLNSNIAHNNDDGFEISGDNNILTANNAYNNSTADFDITGMNTIFGVVTEEPIKLWNIDTATRNALTASNGWMIYNTDTNKGQIYAGGVWVDLH